MVQGISRQSVRSEGDGLQVQLRALKIWVRRRVGLLDGMLRWDSAYNVGREGTEVAAER